MGQCYSVTLSVKLKNERKAISILQKKIARGQQERVRYNEDGKDLSTFESLMRIFLCDRNDEYFTVTRYQGTINITNSFDCCYGWHGLMNEMFEEITPCLSDGSYLEIWPDSGVSIAAVIGGSYSIEFFDEEEIMYDKNGVLMNAGDIVVLADSDGGERVKYEVCAGSNSETVKLLSKYGRCEALPEECIINTKYYEVKHPNRQ